jgi:cobalt-zinc-cadmium efflux system outer membrane protein
VVVVAGGCSNPKTSADVSASLRDHAGFEVPARAATNGWQLPPQVFLEDGLSEDEAVATALWNNAPFHAALADLGIARADLLQAGQLSNPNFSVLFPMGPKQAEFALTLPVEALWIRPRRMAIAKLNERKVAEQLVQRGLDLIRNVRVAFVDVALAQERAGLAQEALTVQSNIAHIARVRLDAGDASELESSTARVVALRAREDVRAANDQLVLARQRLATLLGSAAVAPRLRATAAEPVAPSPPELKPLVDKALGSRPDMRATELELEAAGKRAGLTTAELFTLSAILDANQKDSGGFELGPGLQFPIPVLHQNQAARARARAEIERAAWQIVALRQQIQGDVTGAHADLSQALEALNAWRREVMPRLDETMEQTTRAYQAGEVSLLAVHEVARERVIARFREADLAATVRRAQAELERSVGRKLKP